MEVQAPPVYAIADLDALGPTALADGIGAMASEGIGWIQLRAKRQVPDSELLRLVEACHEAAAGTGAELWMNDRADFAALFPFYGLHLGQTDLPPAAARRVVGPEVRIGLSTHTLEQVEAAGRDDDVDVVAFGPVFGTRSKQHPEPSVGVDGVRSARSRTSKPLVAIGGIDSERLNEVLVSGADSVAMIGAICNGDIRANCRRVAQAAGRGKQADE